MYDEKDFPICAICGDRITDDEFFENGGEYFHEGCLNKINLETWLENHAHDIEEY